MWLKKIEEMAVQRLRYKYILKLYLTEVTCGVYM